MCAFGVTRWRGGKYVALSIDFPAQPSILIAILDAAADALPAPLWFLCCFSSIFFFQLLNFALIMQGGKYGM